MSKPLPPPALSVGAGRTNITPPLGTVLQGLFHEVRAQDVLEDLYANAVVVDDGDGETAIVSVDVCSIPIERCRRIAALIGAACGIPEDRILITATHTHAGPPVGVDLDGVYELWPDYIGVFEKQVQSAVRLAQRRKRPARLAAGRGENRDFVFNRRMRRPDGSPVMNFIAENFRQADGSTSNDYDAIRAILQDCAPMGTVDPEIVALRFEDERGAPIAYLVNYANHNNAQTRPLISADYAGVMGDHLRAVLGRELVVLFLPGAAGNVNWIDSRDAQQWTPALYQKIGRSLAGTVLQIDSRLAYVDAPKVTVKRAVLRIPERPYCDYDITVDGTFGRPEDNTDFWDAYRQAYQRYSHLPLPHHDVPLSAVVFGCQVALAANPCELFVELGLDIKRGSPYPYTLVAELTNGSAGYVPTREAYDFGGYEVRKMPGASFLARDAGEQIVAASLALLKRGG